MSEKDIQRTQTAGNLAWLDLEMTGLNVDHDVIVQAAVTITNKNLDVLEEFACDVWQPPEAFASMTPFVREMHEKTGLLKRLGTAKTDVRQAEQELLKRIAGFCPYPAILCGNSIWNDRKFIDKAMPGLSGYLHYRMLDVSALKVFAQTFGTSDTVFRKGDSGKHDALVDVRNSIAELRHYRTKFLPGTATP